MKTTARVHFVFFSFLFLFLLSFFFLFSFFPENEKLVLEMKRAKHCVNLSFVSLFF